MKHIKILSDTERKSFELPPVLNPTERKLVFALPIWAEEELNRRIQRAIQLTIYTLYFYKETHDTQLLREKR
jgi:hypothetical protein